MLKQIELYEDLLRTAGKFMKNNKNNYRKNYKTVQSQIKSKADQDVNDILVSGIHKISGCSCIISEESQTPFKIEEIKLADECFIVDPIDGTASYIKGFSGYVTQIACLKKGIPIFSLIFSPENEDMYIACKGFGAYLNGAKILAKPTTDSAVFIDNTPKPSVKIREMMQKYQSSSYIECGSIGLKICKVASGEADIFYKDVLVRDWDLIPPALVLEEANGIMLSLEGNEINYFSNHDFSHKGCVAFSSLTLATNLMCEDSKI